MQPYAVHDVQFAAEPLDSTANLQELDAEGVVDGQACRHSVGEVWRGGAGLRLSKAALRAQGSQLKVAINASFIRFL